MAKTNAIQLRAERINPKEFVELLLPFLELLIEEAFPTRVLVPDAHGEGSEARRDKPQEWLRFHVARAGGVGGVTGSAGVTQGELAASLSGLRDLTWSSTFPRYGILTILHSLMAPIDCSTTTLYRCING